MQSRKDYWNRRHPVWKYRDERLTELSLANYVDRDQMQKCLLDPEFFEASLSIHDRN